MTSAEDNARSAVRDVTIRFPQIDAAGIVFYPRYFEMVRRCFPDVPFHLSPFAVTTQFLRPNRLGDVIALEYGNDGHGNWLVSGRMDGHTCFSMVSDKYATPLDQDAHRPDKPGFHTAREPLGDWALGAHGRLQLSRYFELLNMAIEEWFERTLDLPFHELHVGRRIGIPTVQFDTIVRSMPSESAELSIWIRPDKLGDRSMTFTSWLVGNDVCHVQNRQVVVFVGMQDEGYESVSIPAYIAEAFTAELEKERER